MSAGLCNKTLSTLSNLCEIIFVSTQFWYTENYNPSRITTRKYMNSSIIPDLILFLTYFYNIFGTDHGVLLPFFRLKQTSGTSNTATLVRFLNSFIALSARFFRPMSFRIEVQ